MSPITDAIAATSPSIWYRLDESSGTTAANSGSQVNDGTYSGSFELQLQGPEPDTSCARLFLGGQVVSGQMDLSSMVGQTLGFWASMPATTPISTFFPIVGIGNPADRLARGPLISEQHSIMGQPVYYGQYRTSTTVSGGPNQRYDFWHWICVTYATGTNNVKMFVDGTNVSNTTLSSPVNPLATDPLLIKCDEPIVLTHVCWWGGVLTPTQVGSIWSAYAQWPYAFPGNQAPPEGGGGGGLTPEQATQLNEIDTKTDDIPGLVDASNFISDTVNHIKGVTDAMAGKVDQVLTDTTNIVNSLFPQLADVLNDIGASIVDVANRVTGTLQDGAELVQKTVGELLSQRSDSSLATNSATGGSTCIPINLDLAGRRVYGISLEINVYPVDWRWRTPDRAWSLYDLAVIRVYHNGKLKGRQGVHTISHTWSPIPPVAFPWIGPFMPLQFPGTVITVDWADGVCGELFLHEGSI